MSEKSYLNKYLEYKRRYLNLKMSGGALQSKSGGELAARITTDEANIIYDKIKHSNDISGYNPNYKLNKFYYTLKSFAKLAQTTARNTYNPLPEYDAFKKFLILTNLYKFNYNDWTPRRGELSDIFNDINDIVTTKLQRQGVSPLDVECPDPNEPQSYNTERGRICFDRTIEKINSRLISQDLYQARETMFHKFYFDKDQRNVDEVDIPPPAPAATAAAEDALPPPPLSASLKRVVAMPALSAAAASTATTAATASTTAIPALPAAAATTATTAATAATATTAASTATTAATASTTAIPSLPSATGPYIRKVDGSELPTKQELLKSKIDDIKRIFLGTTTVCKVIEFTEGNNKRAYLQINQPGYDRNYETYFVRSGKDNWKYISKLAINSNLSNMSALFQLIGSQETPT